MENSESWLCPDEPYGIYCSYNEQCLTPEAANKFGATVMLTGFGGDEMLCGNPLYLADLLWRGRLKTFLAELSKWSRVKNMSYLYGLTEFGIKPKIPYFLRPFLSVLLRKPIEFWYTFDVDSGPAIPRWIDKHFAQNMSVTRRIPNLVPDKNCQNASMIPEYRSIHSSNTSLGRQVITCPLSVELRQPFYDKRLVEYIMGVPMPYRITIKESGGLSQKLLIKNGMKGILPESIRTRTRGPEFGRRALAGMRADIPEFLRQLDLGNIEIVNRGYVDNNIFREVLSQWVFGYWEDVGCMVNTISLELWLKRHKSKYNI
ncbi:asparagine synthase [Candidatus Poribacteria bacterium]|nr:asparagine synthase [Candidatus Poribacteria bacterium]MYG06703.1 asparagine synthase [Candidatus Poribacteria bacterium]MYK23929.1 asparagine synthase [Candidatus Poribacteria bacterium]